MKSIVCEEIGDPETLRILDMPPPALSAEEVRIKVSACSINFPDLLMISGAYQDIPPLPFIPGGEVSGVVEAVGANVDNLSVGQSVMAVTYTGGLAEYVVAPATLVWPKPESLSAQQAAAFPGVYGTSYHALTQRAQLKKGESLLVLGAAGGVGSAAVQIGCALGARVIAAASTDEKLEFATSNGAHERVNYAKDDIRSSVLSLTDGKGADVIYDPVGGEIFDTAIRTVAWGGRILTVGFASGKIPSFPANRALLKGCSLVGVYFKTFCEKEPTAAARNAEALCKLANDKLITPRVYRVFPFEQFADAMNCLSERNVLGKVVVSIE